MNINGLGGALGQGLKKITDSRPNAQPAPAAKQAMPVAETLPTPAAIYHGSQVEGPSRLKGLENVKLYSRTFDPAVARKMSIEKMDLWIRGLGEVSGDLRRGYDEAVSKLSPELLKKDWGFSVREGRLVLIEGRDRLSEAERSALISALAGLESLANDVANTVIRLLELDRGMDGVSKSIGRFDVSQQNFADIVDLRAYLLSHGPDAKYGRHATNPTDYANLYATGGYAMMDQIAAKAVARFAPT